MVVSGIGEGYGRNSVCPLSPCQPTHDLALRFAQPGGGLLPGPTRKVKLQLRDSLEQIHVVEAECLRHPYQVRSTWVGKTRQLRELCLFSRPCFNVAR